MRGYTALHTQNIGGSSRTRTCISHLVRMAANLSHHGSVLRIVLIPVVLVVAILPNVETIAVQALVVREPHSVLCGH